MLFALLTGSLCCCRVQSNVCPAAATCSWAYRRSAPTAPVSGGAGSSDEKLGGGGGTGRSKGRGGGIAGAHALCAPISKHGHRERSTALKQPLHAPLGPDPLRGRTAVKLLAVAMAACSPVCVYQPHGVCLACCPLQRAPRLSPQRCPVSGAYPYDHHAVRCMLWYGRKGCLSRGFMVLRGFMA